MLSPSGHVTTLKGVDTVCDKPIVRSGDRVTDKAQEQLDCPGPLPGPPYPPGTAMKPVHRDRKGFITALQYVDLWGEIEYIFDKSGLCSRAGCSCQNSIPVCFNQATWDYDPRIALYYAPSCIKRCKCKQADPTSVDWATHIGNGTMNGTDPGVALTVA